MHFHSLLRFHVLYGHSKLPYLPDDIFVSPFYVLHIGDVRISCCDKSRDDHRYSCSEIPTRYGCSTQVGRTKNKCGIGVHDCWVSFHLLDFYEPVQSALINDFFQPTHSLRLREEYGKGGLEVCRESWEDIGLHSNSSELVYGSIHSKGIISQVLISNSDFSTFHEKRMKILDTSILYVKIFF